MDRRSFYIFISLTLFEAKHWLKTCFSAYEVFENTVWWLEQLWVSRNHHVSGVRVTLVYIPVNTVHIPQTVFPSEHCFPLVLARNAVSPEHLQINIVSPYTITSE